MRVSPQRERSQRGCEGNNVGRASRVPRHSSPTPKVIRTVTTELQSSAPPLMSLDLSTSCTTPVPMFRRGFHGDLQSLMDYVKAGGDIDANFHGLPLLIWACTWNDLKLVEQLLTFCADTEMASTINGKTALMHAVVSQKSTELVSLLLRHSASLNTRDSVGCTALMYVCSAGKSYSSCCVSLRSRCDKVIEMLLAAGADFRVRSAKGVTAFGHAWPNLCACEGQDGRGIRRLIAAKANVDERVGGRTLLLQAASKSCSGLAESTIQFCIDAGANLSVENLVDGEGNVVFDLIAENCIETKERFKQGETSANLMPDLCVLCQRAHFLVVQEYMRQGHVADGDTSEQALLGYSAKDVESDVVAKDTAQKRASIADPTSSFNNALHSAAHRGELAKVKRLVASGVSIASKGGKTERNALMYAARNGHAAVVEHLIRAGSPLDDGDNRNFTAAFMAAEKGHDAVLRLLVDAGADGSKAGRLEMDVTPAHAAASKGHPKCLKILIAAGVDVDVETNAGTTPLKNAQSHGHAACVAVLEEASAKEEDLMEFIANYSLLGERAKNMIDEELRSGIDDINYRVDDVVWAKVNLTASRHDEEKDETLVYLGCRGVVKLLLCSKSSSTGEALVSVLFDHAANGDGKKQMNVVPSQHLRRTDPAAQGSLSAGDRCWAVRDLYIDDDNFVLRGSTRANLIHALTPGTVVGLCGKSDLVVQFDDPVDIGTRLGGAIRARLRSERRAINCREPADNDAQMDSQRWEVVSGGIDVSGVYDRAKECHRALQKFEQDLVEQQRNDGFERSRAKDAERAKELAEAAERRRIEQEEQRKAREREEMELRDRELRAKENMRRKAEEESAAAKAKAAAAKAEAREAKKAKERLQQEELGPAIYRTAGDGNIKDLRVLLKRMDGAGAKKRRAVQRWSHAARGETPLYMAAFHGHADAVNLLLEAHFSIDYQIEPASIGFEGATPLYAACEQGHVEVTQLLLTRNADPTRLVKGQLSYDDVAQAAGHAHVVALLERFADEAVKAALAAKTPQARGGSSSGASSASAPDPKPSSAAARRFQPALNIISEDADEEQVDDESEEEDEVEASGDDDAAGVVDDDLADIDDSSIGYLQQQLEQATTTDALRSAINSVELLAREAGGSAERMAPGLASARERLDSLTLEAAVSLNALGCSLPSDVIASGMLSAPSGASEAFVSAHTILVVDCSGSMRNADVVTSEDGTTSGARVTRANAVLGLLTQNFVRTQIEAGAVPSERVSLIKIQAVRGVLRALSFALFPLEPSLTERIAQSLGEPHSDGPFLPALSLLARLVELSAQYLMPRAKTNVLFLSDGRPSDRIDERALPGKLKAALRRVHLAFNSTRTHLESFQLLGFGDADETVLKLMASMVPKNLATYSVGSGATSYASLAQSVSTFSSSVANSRISSVSHLDGKSRALRSINRTLQHRMCRYSECEIFLPPERLGDFASELPALRGLHDIEIASRLLGHGGERNAFLMRFLTPTRFTTVDEEWVVKESRHTRTEEDELYFHRKGLVTQKAAEELANRFNQEVEGLGLQGLPKVAYMTCCYIQTEQMDRRHGEPADPEEPAVRSLFAERKIDGVWRKWNTNFGATVKTVAAAELTVEQDTPSGTEGERLTLSSDLVPQAFSHFTLSYSERPLSQFVGPDNTRGRCLVCDLQGSFAKRQNTFLLSDPVIHSDLGQKNLFGATDMGSKGIDAFLRSHKCNAVCKLLQLPENTKFVRENVGQLENSSVNTSLVSVVKTEVSHSGTLERSSSPRYNVCSHATRMPRVRSRARSIYSSARSSVRSPTVTSSSPRSTATKSARRVAGSSTSLATCATSRQRTSRWASRAFASTGQSSRTILCTRGPLRPLSSSSLWHFCRQAYPQHAHRGHLYRRRSRHRQPSRAHPLWRTAAAEDGVAAVQGGALVGCWCLHRP